ncbi:hypothetical protein RclHR1_04390009 [Rhizophagus clarus]|uniref:Uncharacterized protein n=1 Tax=Rhizophagus clarus TaxID=94130 RepID=A0A2Z6RID0_9GLOM|nr:hypothetical protein RclHR1_04390009 [Rhizophagus clarus]GES93444.1 hypothetical protein GLOIN_2v1875534 [Rhizophagus clarus]
MDYSYSFFSIEKLDYICSLLSEVNFSVQRQRKFAQFALDFLSHTFIRNDTRSFFFLNNGLNKYENNELLKLVFQSNGVNVYRSSDLYYLLDPVISVDFDEYTLERVLQIRKGWFQPYIISLRRLDEEKRREWYQNRNMHDREECMKNDLINNIDQILHGFNYLIDYGVGDLIFGSDYGVYIVIETKWLNINTGKNEQVSRHNSRNMVEHQVKKYKRHAQEKYNTVKVIGASFTNDAGDPR